MKYSLESVKNIIEIEKPNLHLNVIAIYHKKVFYSKQNITRTWVMVKVQCLKCNNIYDAYLNSLLNNHGCNKCSIKHRNDKKRFTYDQVKEIIEITNSHLNLELISTEYIDSAKPLLIKCKICKYEFNGYIGNIKKGQGCFKCARKRVGKNNRLKIEDVKKIIEKLNLKLLDNEYTGQDQKLNLECEFGHHFKKDLSHLQRGQGCPICKSSINKFGLSEEICRAYFEYLFDKKFSRQSPNWLQTDDGNNLILDGYNEKLNLAFEYNGMQHYKHVKHFHKSLHQFNNQRLCDCYKIQLCYKNDVKLIIIPYTIKPNDIYQFIVDECKKLGIKHKNKPFIKIDDLNVYNSTIKKKNKKIDEKLEGSCYKRINNFSMNHATINIKCIKCNQFERNVLYCNLMKRELPKCDYCFHQTKKAELDDILIKFDYQSVGEYIHYKQKMKIECLKCGDIVTKYPKDVMYSKCIGKCKNCN